MEILWVIISLLILIILPPLFFGVPIAVIIGLIISLVKYRGCSPEYTEKRKKYKKAAVIFSIIFGVMAVAVVVLIYYIATVPITFM